MSLALQEQIKALMVRVNKLEAERADLQERVAVLEKKAKEGFVSRTLGLNKNG